MTRRELIALLASTAAVGWPGAVWGQQQSMPVIGFLNGASYDLSAFLVQAFHRGLGETGFVEGRNVNFEYRSAEGQYNRLPALAADLVSRNVNVIAATGNTHRPSCEGSHGNHSRCVCYGQRPSRAGASSTPRQTGW